VVLVSSACTVGKGASCCRYRHYQGVWGDAGNLFAAQSTCCACKPRAKHQITASPAASTPFPATPKRAWMAPAACLLLTAAGPAGWIYHQQQEGARACM
jgi:hypothetical protein